MAPPVLAVAVPLLAALVVAVALAALLVWHRSYRMREAPPPPELTGDTPGPSPARDRTWDPRERYPGRSARRRH